MCQILQSLNNGKTIRKYVSYLFHMSNIRHFMRKPVRPNTGACAFQMLPMRLH